MSAVGYELFLPPYLQSLGYGKIAAVRDLCRRAAAETDIHILTNPIWSGWRGIFEYITCVEYARKVLCSLPTGHKLASYFVVPARYHSASLVFFSQATLDNIAVWTSKRFSLDVKGSNCAFHKNKFRNALSHIDNNFNSIIDKHNHFIIELDNFRQEWIHRLTGGAQIYSDKSPDDPMANVQLAIPINPAINSFEFDRKTYRRMIEKCRQKNNGRWLYPIDKFANKFADGTRDMTVDLLGILLVILNDK